MSPNETLQKIYALSTKTVKDRHLSPFCNMRVGPRRIAPDPPIIRLPAKLESRHAPGAGIDAEDASRVRFPLELFLAEAYSRGGYVKLVEIGPAEGA